MKRLTQIDGMGNYEAVKCFECHTPGNDNENCGLCDVPEIIENQLGKYEDTGLTPEGILKQQQELKEYKQAEFNNLLIRLPCEVEDKVYVVEDNKIIQCKIISFEVRKDYVKAHCFYQKNDRASCVFKVIKEKAFKTKEKAEKALKEKCRLFGCTDNNACEDGCYWVEKEKLKGKAHEKGEYIMYKIKCSRCEKVVGCTDIDTQTFNILCGECFKTEQQVKQERDLRINKPCLEKCEECQCYYCNNKLKTNGQENKNCCSCKPDKMNADFTFICASFYYKTKYKYASECTGVRVQQLMGDTHPRTVRKFIKLHGDEETLNKKINKG